MAKQFSIEKAASDTSINKKPGILVKIFRRLLLSQFKDWKMDPKGYFLIAVDRKKKMN